ncbi:hypothetical protein [bacterium endosymbiont of Pedicinus badii]|nr:hypothetical protein [bacterium endosymbiont of Pedicinus badii]
MFIKIEILYILLRILYIKIVKFCTNFFKNKKLLNKIYRIY